MEYEQGLRDTAPQQSIKTQLIEVIDRATVDKPTMPQLVERLQLQGVSVRHGLTRNGKSKGISYSWNDQKFSGTSLGPAYTFPGLQKHKFIDYQPQRDDARIEHLLKNDVQQAVDANALKLAQPLTTDKPKLTPNQTAELYKYYSSDLQNLLVTDRDKGIAIRALSDNKPAQDVEEIILASPAGWTNDEAEALVLIANNQLASNREQKQSLPQFTPPAEDESLRPVLQYYLTHTRALTNFLVQPLQRQGLAYIDPYEKVVFIKRDLDGSKSGALVWDTARIDNRCTEYPEYSDGLRPAGGDRQKGWFHLKLGGEADDKIERVYLCSSPIDALTMAEIDRNGHKGQPPARTMYMAVDDPDNLPFELLRNINRIGVAFNNDDHGNEAAQVVQEMLPQAKRIAPSGRTWNEILIEQQQQQQQEIVEQCDSLISESR